MKPLRAFSLILLMATIVFSQPQPTDLPRAAHSMSGATPEMDRLAKALAGDWNTVESMERGQFFPTGGSRHGVVHARLASGGYTLVYEVHSDGSAGKLDGFHTIWWDKNRQLYYFFACFNNPDGPCRMRGTAHWEGDSFVNDYEFMVNGKSTRWRDTFKFTPNSHTLVAAMDSGLGAMKKVITTTATRATSAQSGASPNKIWSPEAGDRISGVHKDHLCAAPSRTSINPSTSS
jgi:hypothetical protein